ncbi:MAG: hypothetical protein IT519_18600 [Burkholderiales bacterium]|jgi:hypothetical protein|nr:hypothetical protein [Burkholderiales bacterium]
MGGFLVRIVLAVALVLATWNPAGWSYAQWALSGAGGIDATKSLVGLLLLGGWILCLRATWVSLGALGVVFLAALIAAFVWWLASMGYVATDQRTLAWIAAVAIGIVLGVGMGWSLLRQKATGQVEVE